MKPRKQIIVRNHIEKLQMLIDNSIPFTFHADMNIVKVGIFAVNRFKFKESGNDVKNALDWLWRQSKKHYPESFEGE